MKKILLLLVASLVSVQVLAVDDLENVSSKADGSKKEEKNLKGSSAGLGYNVKFADNKDANFHIWGLARMYFYPTSPDTKLIMPHFRMNLDVQKDENWSLHARLDYGQWIKSEYYKLNGETPDDSITGGASFYYSRAYLSYTDGNFTYSAGRMLNQAVKYDVLDKYTAFDAPANRTKIVGAATNWTDSTYQSGEGVRVDYKNGGVDAAATITYLAGSNKTEQFLYTAFFNHSLELNKDSKFEYGSGVSTSSHDDANPQFVEVTPHAGLFLGDYYILDQFMVRDLISMRDSALGSVSDYDLLMRNHLEVGKKFNVCTKELTLDAYLASVMYDGDSVHDVGLEAEVKFNDRFSFNVNTQYDNVANSEIEREDEHEGLRRLSYYAFVNYYF